MKTRKNFKSNLSRFTSSFWVLALSFLTSVTALGQMDNIDLLIQNFASDYETDLMFQEKYFGLKVDKEFWTIKTTKGKDMGSHKVEVSKGKPTEPTFYYVTNARALQQINNGKMNALTAGVKAFSTDYAPLDIDVMEGFQPPADFAGAVLPFTFHFFTKGTPEVIPFGKHNTRATHGAMASIFYYDTGVRSGYGYIHPGQHANEHPLSRTNPFPSLIILIKGEVTAKLGGVDYTVKAGNAIFIPPGMTHEFLNETEEAVEFILLMFGDGA